MKMIVAHTDGFQATIRGIAATSSSYIGAYILENNGPMTALSISFCIATTPPIIGAVFVPETLGMRTVDFNEEKKEEKIQRALSQEEDGEGLGSRLLSMLSGEQEDSAPTRNTTPTHENYTEMSSEVQQSSSGGSERSNREIV